MAILITVLIALVVIGFGVYVFGGLDSVRHRQSGQQSLESWYSRFSDRHRR